jgi:uncharacterized protein YlxW (UPF0749 family)
MNQSDSTIAVLCGLVGIVLTKIVDAFVARLNTNVNENADFRRVLKSTLEEERKDRAEREKVLLNEIHKLSEDLKETASSLHLSRRETMQAYRTSLRLERRIIRLEALLAQHGIALIEEDDSDEPHLDDMLNATQ